MLLFGVVALRSWRTTGAAVTLRELAFGSALAWIVGRPWLAAVGLVTVLPFLLAYARARRR